MRNPFAGNCEPPAICDIKALYTETHDGFSQAKGVRREDRIKVSDMAAFSVAACQ